MIKDKNKYIIVYKKRAVGPLDCIKKFNIENIKTFIETNHNLLPENDMVYDPYTENDVVVFDLINKTVSKIETKE